MPCKVTHNKEGLPTMFQCGPAPKPKDHECDGNGEFKELETGMGTVYSATCSVCGRPAFNEWDAW
jgi:hypothetical protein